MRSILLIGDDDDDGFWRWCVVCTRVRCTCTHFDERYEHNAIMTAKRVKQQKPRWRQIQTLIPALFSLFFCVHLFYFRFLFSVRTTIPSLLNSFSFYLSLPLDAAAFYFSLVSFVHSHSHSHTHTTICWKALSRFFISFFHLPLSSIRFWLFSSDFI